MPVPDRVFEQMSEMSDAVLRCALALIHLSFRFDPDEETWVHAGKSFTRREVQKTCGLSSEGTRQGLSDLDGRGWTEIDKSGRSYQYRLEMEVPERQFTYLPTSLLGKASRFASATTLRVLLAIFRGTWGWTQMEAARESGNPRPVHRRWARLSTSDLSRLTGHSETAVKRAAQDLEGEWIGRARPSQGAYLYRVLPEAFGPQSTGEEKQEEPSSNPPTANEVTPHRQQSGPPTSYRESFSRDRHSQDSQKQKEPPGARAEDSPEEAGAVPGEKSNQRGSQEPTFEDFPSRKRSLGQKLTNAGIWPGEVEECLTRYSAPRIEANFRLWRRRKNSSEGPEIENDGAWLYDAITKGYADPSGSSQDDSCPESSKTASGRPDHKEKVGLQEKKTILRQCSEVEDAHFHRFSRPEDPSAKAFLYLDPKREKSGRGASETRQRPAGRRR